MITRDSGTNPIIKLSTDGQRMEEQFEYGEEDETAFGDEDGEVAELDDKELGDVGSGTLGGFELEGQFRPSRVTVKRIGLWIVLVIVLMGLVVGASLVAKVVAGTWYQETRHNDKGNVVFTMVWLFLLSCTQDVCCNKV